MSVEKNAECVVGACHPSYGRKLQIGDCSTGHLEQKVAPYLKNNESKKEE
jgi:hypothetical protein